MSGKMNEWPLWVCPEAAWQKVLTANFSHLHNNNTTWKCKREESCLFPHWLLYIHMCKMYLKSFVGQTWCIDNIWWRAERRSLAHEAWMFLGCCQSWELSADLSSTQTIQSVAQSPDCSMTVDSTQSRWSKRWRRRRDRSSDQIWFHVLFIFICSIIFPNHDVLMALIICVQHCLLLVTELLFIVCLIDSVSGNVGQWSLQ